MAEAAVIAGAAVAAEMVALVGQCVRQQDIGLGFAEEREAQFRGMFSRSGRRCRQGGPELPPQCRLERGACFCRADGHGASAAFDWELGGGSGQRVRQDGAGSGNTVLSGNGGGVLMLRLAGFERRHVCHVSVVVFRLTARAVAGQLQGCGCGFRRTESKNDRHTGIQAVHNTKNRQRRDQAPLAAHEKGRHARLPPGESQRGVIRRRCSNPASCCGSSCSKSPVCAACK